MKKIDIHCHTTNRKVEKVLPVDCSLEGIQKEMEKYDIEQSIVLATYFPHKKSGISNFRLYSWIKDNPKFLMFGSLDFEHYYFQGMNELNELAELNKIKGIKIYTCYQEIDLHSNRFKEVINLAEKYSLPMMFHCGYSYSAMSRLNKPSITGMVKSSDIEFIANENPELKLIASHLCKPFIDDVIDVVKRNKNLYTDMSGLMSSKREQLELPNCVENIKNFLGECGPSRLLFGTDFPVQTHKDSVYMLEQAMKNYSDTDKQKVYYDNAMELLK